MSASRAVLQAPVMLAALWMVGALFSLMMLAVSARELSSDLTTFQIIFLRSVVSLLLVLPMLHMKGWGQIRTTQPGVHLVRNLAHMLGQYAWIVGIASISLAEVFALEFTAPIWATLIAALWLGEKINRFRVLSLLLGMTGVLIIVRPGFAQVHPAIVVVLGSAVSFALAHTLTKKLVGRDSPLAIIFYMTVVHLVCSVIPAVMAWNPVPAGAWFWILMIAGVSITAHFSMARAFALADAMVVIPMDFLRLPLVAVVGFLFYQEALDWLVMLGALVMFSGNVINVLMERRLDKAKN